MPRRIGMVGKQSSMRALAGHASDGPVNGGRCRPPPGSDHLTKARRHAAHFSSATVVLWLICVFSVAVADAAETIHEYVFLIDTSASMRTNKLVGPLRVAVGDFADTIPKDGSSRVWIFMFDKGLNKDYLIRQLNGTDDLQQAKIFLSSAEYQGEATYIYQSLDIIFTTIEQTLRDGTSHDFTIHLFTDGQDNGSPTYSFEKNAARFVRLRAAARGAMELYYHSLKTEVPANLAKVIQSTEGMYSITDVGIPPKARFVLPPKVTVMENTPATFVNETIGQVDKYDWALGDGSVSNEKSPTHTFKKPGTYTITLIASNTVGKSKTSVSVEVRGAPPQAKFAIRDPEKPKYVGEPVGFIDRSVGQVTSRTWQFGEGLGKSTDANPQFVFKETGRVGVTLHVDGPFGNDESTVFLTIEQRPTLAFSFFPKEPVQKQEVVFVNQSKGDFRSWRWDFGDGTTSQEMSPRHVYAQPGTYKLHLEGQDGLKAWTKSATQEVIIGTGYVKPVAKFTLPVETIGIGEQLTLTDQSTGTIESWVWDMGDGTVIKAPSAKHAYKKDGKFKIVMTVSGPAGSSTAENDLVVQPAVLDFSFSPIPPVDGKPVIFVNESLGSYRDWNWNFGDGTNSSAKNPQHTYKKPGKYTARLTAIGPGGEHEEKSKDISVASSAVPPKAKFNLQLKTVELGTPITLTHASTGTITKVEWDLGDGAKLTGDKVEHQYAKPGDYRIALTVSNETASDSTSQMLKVQDMYQEATIVIGVASKTRGAAPLEVAVTNHSTGSIASYSWDFGDGTTSDDREPPPHEYATPGQYTISLTVIDRKGQSSRTTSSQNIIVEVLPPPLYGLWVPWLAALLGYAATGLLVWRGWWPWNRRSVYYDEDGDPKRYTGWRHDWVHNSSQFAILMRRTMSLCKRYYLQTFGVVSVQDMTGNSLSSEDRIRASSEIRIGEGTKLTIQKLNDGPWSCIAAQVAALTVGAVVLAVLLNLR